MPVVAGARLEGHVADGAVGRILASQHGNPGRAGEVLGRAALRADWRGGVVSGIAHENWIKGDSRSVKLELQAAGTVLPTSDCPNFPSPNRVVG